MSAPIYLDNHATTRVDPRVVDAMQPYFDADYGNAASAVHIFGERARAAVEEARASIAAAINADPDEIIFTSGATESNNLALRGVAERERRRGDRLLSVRTEHRSVLDPITRLARRGFQATLLDVEQHGSSLAGRLAPDRFAEALGGDVLLASVMLANNEIGVVQPIAELAATCRAANVPLHCDATQAVGKIPVDVRQLGVDLMSFSAHKLYGPKGVGALFVRRRGSAPIRLEPLIAGGGHEQGLRSGTLNVPGIVGFAAAVQLCRQGMADDARRMASLRDRLWERLHASISDVEICGPALEEVDGEGRPLRLPNNVNVAIEGVDGEAVMLRSPEIAVSSGAACSSVEPGPSHVMLALGLPEDRARSTLRFGLGRWTTADEVDRAAAAIARSVAQLRALAT